MPRQGRLKRWHSPSHQRHRAPQGSITSTVAVLAVHSRCRPLLVHRGVGHHSFLYGAAVFGQKSSSRTSPCLDGRLSTYFAAVALLCGVRHCCCTVCLAQLPETDYIWLTCMCCCCLRAMCRVVMPQLAATSAGTSALPCRAACCEAELPHGAPGCAAGVCAAVESGESKSAGGGSKPAAHCCLQAAVCSILLDLSPSTWLP
jgi:hypothetical protein